MLAPDIDSPYVTYTLNPMEEFEGTTLSPAQRARIQNLKMEIVEQKLQLAPTSLTADGKESYWQQEAYFRGQLELCTYLLTASDAATKAALESPSEINNPI